MSRLGKLVFLLATLFVITATVGAVTITVAGINSGQISTVVSEFNLQTVIPEPSSILLLGGALLGLGGLARRRRRTRK